MKIEKTVDRGSKEKLYVQMRVIFLEKIESGEWISGLQIPSEDDLCRAYDVSKVTIREAIQELVREGYLRRQQGKGTFVIYSMPHPGIVMRTRLSDDMYGEEVRIVKEVIDKGYRGVPDEIKQIFMTEEDLYYILRRKVVDEEPFKEEIFIPSFILPDLAETAEISEKSLYDIIELKGTKKIFKIVQTMELTELRENTAALLHAREGTPALLISRILISSDGSPVGFTRLVGCGMKHKFMMEFERIK